VIVVIVGIVFADIVDDNATARLVLALSTRAARFSPQCFCREFDDVGLRIYLTHEAEGDELAHIVAAVVVVDDNPFTGHNPGRDP
jgi:hypothetical protein